jgi:hypothetical protein
MNAVINLRLEKYVITTPVPDPVNLVFCTTKN